MFDQPLHFDPYLRPMVWGGRRLGDVLGKPLPTAENYGESWDVSDHPHHRSVVAVVRSFVAIPAGLFRERFSQFLPLAALGSAAFCFGLAAGGWALGSSYNSLHDALTYMGIALVVVVAATVGVVWYRKRSSNMARRAEDSAR